MLAGFVLIYTATIVIKTVYFKNRPVKFSYNSYIEKLDASSFPSLHASRTAFLGLVLSKYFSSYIFTAIMVVLILAIAYTRVYLKKHDFMDVSAGIILGILVYFGVNLIVS
jgi:membrane-associated phospholipid phosphatase